MNNSHFSDLISNFPTRADYKHELIGERLLTTPKNYAYLKISEGCDRPCSFCAIPLMRGKVMEIPIQPILVQLE